MLDDKKHALTGREWLHVVAFGVGSLIFMCYLVPRSFESVVRIAVAAPLVASKE